MRLAIQTPVQQTTFGRLRDLWAAAADSGVEAAFTYDHLVALAPGARPGAIGPHVDGPQLDGWITAAALAAVTPRLSVGTLVSSVTHRHPAVLAKMASSLHAITDGRAVLGIGSGWHEVEHRQFGIPFPAVGDRMALLEETVAAVRSLLSASAPVDFEGRFIQLAGAQLDPRPDPGCPLPILVGGSGPRLRRIAARHADIYNGFWPPSTWTEVNNELDALVAAAGRPSGALRRSAFVNAELSTDPAAHTEFVAAQGRQRGGTPAEVRARVVLGDDSGLDVLRSFHQAGVDQVVMYLDPWAAPNDLARFAGRVTAEMRKW